MALLVSENWSGAVAVLGTEESSKELHSPVISLTHKLLAISRLCWSRVGNTVLISRPAPRSALPTPLFRTSRSLKILFLRTNDGYPQTHEFAKSPLLLRCFVSFLDRSSPFQFDSNICFSSQVYTYNLSIVRVKCEQKCIARYTLSRTSDRDFRYMAETRLFNGKEDPRCQRRSGSMGTKRAHLCRRSADLFWSERISRGAEERGTGPRC